MRQRNLIHISKHNKSLNYATRIIKILEEPIYVSGEDIITLIEKGELKRNGKRIVYLGNKTAFKQTITRRWY
jgi:hypothetical protein